MTDKKIGRPPKQKDKILINTYTGMSKDMRAFYGGFGLELSVMSRFALRYVQKGIEKGEIDASVVIIEGGK